MALQMVPLLNSVLLQARRVSYWMLGVRKHPTNRLTGSIGQPDASGAATGGSYRVSGGFWQPVTYLAYVPIVMRL